MVEQLYASVSAYLIQPGTGAAVVIGLSAAVLTLMLGNSFMGHSRARGSLLLPSPFALAPLGIPVQQRTTSYHQASMADRRNAARRSGNPIKLLLAPAHPGGEPVEAWVRDRSVGGLGLTTDRPLAPGTVWTVRPAEAPQTASSVTVEVRHCSLRDHTWLIGCQFQEIPPWSVMLQFG